MKKQREAFNGELYLRGELTKWEEEPLAFLAFLVETRPEEMTLLTESYRRVNPHGAEALMRIFHEKRDTEYRLKNRIATAPTGL